MIIAVPAKGRLISADSRRQRHASSALDLACKLCNAGGSRRLHRIPAVVSRHYLKEAVVKGYFYSDDGESREYTIEHEMKTVI